MKLKEFLSHDVSTYRADIVEDLFKFEVKQEMARRNYLIDIAPGKVDMFGYDYYIADNNQTLRVQLKTSCSNNNGWPLNPEFLQRDDARFILINIHYKEDAQKLEYIELSYKMLNRSITVENLIETSKNKATEYLIRKEIEESKKDEAIDSNGAKKKKSQKQAECTFVEINNSQMLNYTIETLCDALFPLSLKNQFSNKNKTVI